MSIFLYRLKSLITSGYRLGSLPNAGYFARSLKDYTISVEFPKGPDPTVPGDSGNTKRGVAILLGWTGSKAKSMDNYSQLYLTRHHAVLKVCPSTVLILKFGSRKIVSNLTEDIHETLKVNNLTEVPLFFHVFSNGGCMLYCALMTNWRHRKQTASISGTIFDSGPARVTMTQISNSIAAAVPGNRVFKNGCGLLGILWAYATLYGNYLADWMERKDVTETDACRFYFYETMEALPNLGPELFLFSKRDRLIDYRDVQSYMDSRKMAGVKTQYRLWDDSEHVKHLLAHTTEYVNLLNSFIQGCETKLI